MKTYRVRAMAVALVEANSPEEAIGKFAKRNPDTKNQSHNFLVSLSDEPIGAGRLFDTSTGKVIASDS
jgi:hypothetical protein